MRVQRILGILVVLLAISLSANAQATRTWVSGVGDDVNPCSRTAPCKTFAGAISKTAAGGEISVLDPGGFGALTITKSITIEGADFVASVLASGTSGIIINAGANGRVYLRNLTFNGAPPSSPGLVGIKVLTAGTVSIEGCTIFDFSQSGIDIEPTSPAKVAISNTSIRDNNGFGIFVKPNGGSVSVTLDHVQITGTTGNGIGGNGSALEADGGSVVKVVDSVLSESAMGGLFVRNGSEVSVQGSSIFRNGIGISVGDVGGGTVRLFGSDVVNNYSGINIATTGTVVSHGNNAIAGNGGSQSVSSNIGTQ